MYVGTWLSGMILSLTCSWAGFDPSLKCPMYLATQKSCDTTKQSFCGYIYIYIGYLTNRAGINV